MNVYVSKPLSLDSYWISSKDGYWQLCKDDFIQMFGKVKKGVKYRIYVSKKKLSDYKKIRVNAEKEGIGIDGEWAFPFSVPENVLSWVGSRKHVWVKLVKM